MIGYIIQQELGNELPFERHLATLLTQIEVDPDDPAFSDPTKPIGPIYDEAEAERLAGEGLDVQARRRQLAARRPSPLPKRIFEIEAIDALLQAGLRRYLRRRRRHPDDVHRRARARGQAPRRRRGRDRQGPRERAARGRPRGGRARDRDGRRRGLHGLGDAEQRAIRRATPASLAASEFAEGSMGPKVRAACSFVEQTGQPAAIGSISTRRRSFAARPARSSRSTRRASSSPTSPEGGAVTDGVSERTPRPPSLLGVLDGRPREEACR